MKNIKRLLILFVVLLVVLVACGQSLKQGNSTDTGKTLEIDYSKAEPEKPDPETAKESEKQDPKFSNGSEKQDPKPAKEPQQQNPDTDKEPEKVQEQTKTKKVGEDKRTIYLEIGQLDKNQAYYSMEDVAGFLLKYGELPKNYLTKRQAMSRGWNSSSGNLWKVTDKGVIGGDNFGNREGQLPKKSGRRYFEADVEYTGGRRNAHRLVFTNDGLVYYTSNHYKTFKEVKEQ